MDEEIIVYGILLMVIIVGVSQAPQEETILKSMNLITFDDPQGYVASITSDVYHTADCFYSRRILPENKIWFETREEARRAGYRKSKWC